jgi:Zn-finger nucleic acid-binding protein
MDASSLHCPNCGAAVESDAGRCPYCRARLATVSCPSCFALGFEGAAYCHRCGAARTRRPEDDAGLACPACRKALQRIDVGGTPLLECGACDGIWVDADVFERLCAGKEAQAAVLERLTPRQPRPPAGPVKYRPCVRCGKMMNRVNFGKLSGAVIDVCRGHGTYLDAGELHQIVAFITGGGLDRARTRAREELREEERRLRDLERKAMRELRDSRGSPFTVSAEWGDSGISELIRLITNDPA